MGKRHRSHTDPQWWYKEVSTFQELEIQPTSSTPFVNRETEASKTGEGGVSFESLLQAQISVPCCPAVVFPLIFKCASHY